MLTNIKNDETVVPYGREGIAIMFVDALDVVVDGWMEVCGELKVVGMPSR